MNKQGKEQKNKTLKERIKESKVYNLFFLLFVVEIYHIYSI